MKVPPLGGPTVNNKDPGLQVQGKLTRILPPNGVGRGLMTRAKDIAGISNTAIAIIEINTRFIISLYFRCNSYPVLKR